MPRRITIRRPPVIALLTDFGLSDHFVGVMKGVILQRLPTAQLLDITHAIEPGRIRQGAFVLWSAAPYLPDDTVVLAVVDPGVGTDRPVSVVRSRRLTFVGPENGLFDLVRADDRTCATYRPSATSLAKWSYPDRSTTFHGRDIFAPLAAELAAGRAPERIGKRVRADRPDPWRATRSNPSVAAEIMAIDRFGNLITNIELPSGQPIHSTVRMVSIGKIMVSQAIRTYDEAPDTTPCLIRGSSGLLEVVVRGRSASLLLGAHDRTPIQVVWA
jgi:S-adenosylmethionine hydrolase